MEGSYFISQRPNEEAFNYRMPMPVCPCGSLVSAVGTGAGLACFGFLQVSASAMRCRRGWKMPAIPAILWIAR